MKNCFSRSWLLALGSLVAVGVCLDVHAQWQSQSFVLKPGWNAIFTHVDGTYQSLDALVPDANGAVAEIWLWKPTFSTIQFVDSPYTNATPNTQWAVWTSGRGDTDTLTSLVGNGAYLIRNRSQSDFVWTIKGKPVAPSYQWTTTGLNFIGFPTPASTPPNFADYLVPEPNLDLAKTLQNQAHVFRYPGGDLGASNPSEVVSFSAATTPVTRGQAFWVRGSTNFYNRYYGPVEVTLQDPAGLQFGDSLGTYAIRLRNLTASSRTVQFSLQASETPPAGQAVITGLPQLLVRGQLSTTTLTYDSSVLSGQRFALPAKGQAGSEIEVVIGLNRTLMTGPAGALYAGVLRIADSGNLQQVDVPVSASVPDASGLWVGQASINQVGQYLKSYPKVDTSLADQAGQIDSAAAAAGRPPNGAEIPGASWTPREANVTRAYSAVSSSLDGRMLVAAVSGGSLYVSQNYGTNWVARDSNRNWSDVAASADGSVMAAVVFNGPIYVSSDYGTNWSATASGNAAWSAVSLSADGSQLTAAVQSGTIFTSPNRGATFVARTAAGTRNWSGVATSADGNRIVASVNPGFIYTSSDGGGSWRTNAFSAAWAAVASSADGNQLAAAISGGNVYTSTDGGASWIMRGNTNRWNSVAMSTDGHRLVAAAINGQIFSSDDSGANWTAREQSRTWDDVVASGDATRLVAVVNNGFVYTLSRRFASYSVESASGLVTDQDGLYLSSGVNTNLAKTSREFPLRLVLHHRSVSNQVNLLQHVYVGAGVNSTNIVVATREAFLDPGQLASARRISATHLPFSRTNQPWSAAGNLGPGSVVIFTVNESYKDQASNPFLHTFHPDHDNLDVNFASLQPRGVESYDITRTLRLTFTTPGNDFASLTASAQSRSGVYEETMTLGAQGGASRDFRLSGSFTLQLISPVSTLTTE